MTHDTSRTDQPTTRPRTPLAAPLHAIESSTALDPVVAVGDRVSGAIVADDLRRQVLQGAWLGHALHPLLVEVPMGTWMSATLLDLAGDDASRDGARLLTGVGVLAAVPAARRLDIGVLDADVMFDYIDKLPKDGAGLPTVGRLGVELYSTRNFK